MAKFFRLIGAIVAVVLPVVSMGNLAGSAALKRLTDGNMRFYQGKSIHPNQGSDRREQVAGVVPTPFAIVLGCSDSRVPPEIVFDQGLGDLFNVRVIGNIADEVSIGSVEYAVEEEGVQLIVVLGHERCLTVKAALLNQRVGGDAASIVEEIKRVIAPVRNMPGNALDNAIRANVAYAVNKMKTVSPILAQQLQNGQLQIVGGIYDLDTGIVEFLSN